MNPLPTVEEIYDESGKRIGVTVRQGLFAWTFDVNHIGPRAGCGDPGCPRRQLHEDDGLPTDA